MSEIAIRQADLEADREVLIASLLEHLTPRSSLRRHCWFYLENPHGPARAWIALEGGRVIGSGAIIPRLMYVDGVERQAVVMADFWIHPAFRSLGLAVKLQRACVSGAAAIGFAFFDLPQGKMPAVYQRMKLLGDERLHGLAKPLTTHAYVRKVVGDGAIARALSFVGDRYLRYSDVLRSRSRRTGCTISRHEGQIGNEFSTLAQRVSRNYGTCVARSAQYLTWRYRAHYYVEYEIYTARRDGELIAYAVLFENGVYFDIVDLFGYDDPEVMQDLILGVAEILRLRGKAALTIALHAPARRIEALSNVGFRERDQRVLVIRSRDGDGNEKIERLPGEREWFLTYGDIDY